MVRPLLPPAVFAVQPAELDLDAEFLECLFGLSGLGKEALIATGKQVREPHYCIDADVFGWSFVVVEPHH